MTALVLILILSFLVIIHELGHLLAAFWSGIKVEEFGLGYPPMAKTLFTWKKIPFTLNWIPFGGFVRMSGEEANAEDTLHQKTGQFYHATITQRLFVVLAGAGVNFIFGILAFTIIFSFMGIPRQIPEARIGFIAPDSPAATSHIPTNVTITAIEANGERVVVHSPDEVVKFVAEHRGQDIIVYTTGTCEKLNCQSGEQQFATHIRTQDETPTGQGSLGIGFQDTYFEFYPWWQMPFKGAWYGLQQALYLGLEILKALQMLVKNIVTQGTVPSELAGPVGIVHQAQSAGLLQQGLLAVISFAGMLSINLAIMNVLPIPPLDGGKALFTVLESVLSRKHLHQLEYWVNYVGYIFLVGLIVVVTVRDIAQIVF